MMRTWRIELVTEATIQRIMAVWLAFLPGNDRDLALEDA
jgi:hypothetical protein